MCLAVAWIKVAAFVLARLCLAGAGNRRNRKANDWLLHE